MQRGPGTQQPPPTPGPPAAKNVILAGVKSVKLQDTNAVSLRDLGAQFYLQESSVGKNRAEACRWGPAFGGCLGPRPGLPWPCGGPGARAACDPGGRSCRSCDRGPRSPALCTQGCAAGAQHGGQRHGHERAADGGATVRLPGTCHGVEGKRGGGRDRAGFLDWGERGRGEEGTWETAAVGVTGHAVGAPCLTDPRPLENLSPARRVQVVVVVDLPLEEAIRVDEFCHAQGIAFIRVRARACRGG